MLSVIPLYMINLSDLVYESGKVENISIFSKDERDIDGVLISFEAISVFITVDIESDEILLLEAIPDNFRTLLGIYALQDCIGANLQWAWFMDNQQNYRDGIRLEFDNGLIYELVAIASSLKILRVHEV
jgi:hypothetical protein